MSRSNWKKDKARRLTPEWKEYQRNWMRKWRNENRAHYLAHAKKYREQNREKHLETTRVWRKNNPLTRDLYYKRAKKAALAMLGDVCTRCGFSDERALQIDHINGDGYIERKTKNYWTLIKEIAESGGQNKYQLLCANCNQIKRIENKEYRRDSTK